MFASYAAKGDHLDRYIEYLKTRDYAQEMWLNSRVTEEVRAKAAEKGLTIMKVEV